MYQGVFNSNLRLNLNFELNSSTITHGYLGRVAGVGKRHLTTKKAGFKLGCPNLNPAGRE
jgi:hypothetical protein